MDDNTRGNILSNANHAIREVEGIVKQPTDADHVWDACELLSPVSRR